MISRFLFVQINDGINVFQTWEEGINIPFLQQIVKQLANGTCVIVVLVDTALGSAESPAFEEDFGSLDATEEIIVRCPKCLEKIRFSTNNPSRRFSTKLWY